MSLNKFAATAITLLLALNLGRAADVALPAEWTMLMKQIQTKIDTGKTAEADYKEDLAAWDKLIAGENSSQTNEVAFMLYKRAELYYLLFQDLDKSQRLYQKVSDEYPGFELASQAAHNAEALNYQLEQKRIHDSLAPGNVFPDFAEKDLDGKSLSVSNYPGKVVLVDFWANWCPLCLIELPSVIKLYKAQHAQGLEVIGVCMNKTGERDELTKYQKKNPDMKWPQYFDGLEFQNKLAVKYGVEALPWNALIGRDGKIIGTNLHGTDLENAIKKALETK